jgi:hypothetical protein
MKMLGFRFFLSLCILFLCGYSRTYAHADRCSANDSSAKLSESLEQASLDTDQKSPALVIKPASSSREKKRFFKLEATEVRVEEEDEDESGSFRRNFESGNCFTILSTRSHGYVRSDKISPFYKYFSYTESSRYIIFQVFRI